jgi:predicted kinase
MNKPLLIMFVGVPGSGKTTFARQLRDKIGGVTINSDSIRLSMWGSREAITETHATQEQRKYANQLTFGAMDYAAGQIIGSGYNVIYDCNANKREEREKIQGIAMANGGVSVVIRVNTPHDVAIQRGVNRTETHDQPKFLVEKAEEVVDRFAREIEEPTMDESTIEISGELSFEEQFQIFQSQLAAMMK